MTATDYELAQGALGRRLHLYETHADWLRARQIDHRIGASDVAAIKGVSPWSDAWTLYSERILGIRTERTPAELADLQRGVVLEPAVRSLYALQTGLRPLHLPGIVHIQHADVPWAVCSPDGIVRAPDTGEIGGLECKTATTADGWDRNGGEIEAWAEGSEARIPPVYALQVYWSLEVSGLPWWDVAVLLPWYALRCIRVYADPAVQGAILRDVTAWREHHLVHGEPPEIDGSAACRRALPRPPRKDVAFALPEQIEAVRAWRSAERAFEAAKRERDLRRNQLEAAMGDAYQLRLGPDSGRVTRGGNGLRFTT